MKIAIFGGTFDPIHCAHLSAAREAADHYALDRVLFIPAGNPPHKPQADTAPYEDRFRMVQLACEGEPRFEPSRLEESSQKSYAILTIEKVRNTLRPDDRLYFLIGADAFAEITSWHRWAEVVTLVDFIVATRPGHAFTSPPGSVVHRLDTLALDVSSSEIRRKIAMGERPDELPPAVLAYIRDRRLYM